VSNFPATSTSILYFILNQHADLDIYTVSSLKQQSQGRQVAPTQTHYPDSKQTSVCSYYFCMLRLEVENTNFIVFELI